MQRIVFVILLLNSFSHLLQAQQIDSTRLKATNLQEIIITEVPQAADVSSEFSARMSIKSIENPQVTHSVTGKLLQNRNYFVQYNMLSNVTGVSPSWAGVSPYYTIRGFRTRSNFRNGILGYVASDTDPVTIAQLDVIKGPSGTLFGSSMTVFGGVINRVTVKPQPDRFTSITLSGGTNNFQRATIDVNTPLDQEAKALMRITGAYTHKESFQDQGIYRNIFLAPSFSYQLNHQLKIEVEAEVLRRVSTNNSLITPANPLKNGVLVNAEHPDQLLLNYYQSYTNNSVLYTTNAVNVYGKMTYLLSKKWKSETHFVQSSSQSQGDYQTMSLIDNNTSLVRKIVNYNPESIVYQQVQQNVTGEVSTGKIRHRLLLGLDYYHYVYATSANGLDGTRTNTSGSDIRTTFDTLSLIKANGNAALLNKTEIDNRLSGKAPALTRSPLTTYSAYVSDVINPVKNVTLMLSARMDMLNNRGTYNQTQNTESGAYRQVTFSPKIGLTYQFIPEQFSFFASYMNGFQNVAPVSQVDGSVSNFRPQYGNQLETGFKYISKYNLLDVSVSYYDIAVSNTVRANPERITMFIQDGKQYSKGVELDIQARPFSGFYLHGGIAYNDSKLILSDANTQDLRPVNSGPAWMGNFYANYLLSKGGMKGLSFGLGGNYYGKDYIINSRSAGRFYTNAYTVVNAVLSYSQRSYVFSVSGDNLLNTKYYYGGRGFITPGNLRQIILSLKLSF